MSAGLSEQDAGILEEAHIWRLRQSESDFSEADEAEFKVWLNTSRRHSDLYDFAVTMFHAVGRLGPDDLDKDMLQSSWREKLLATNFTLATLTRKRRGGAIALVGLAAVCIGFFALSPNAQISTPVDQQVITRFQTDPGKVEDITLADGTAVSLGAASEIEVAYSTGHREITLLSGAAYFDVAHEPKRPFTVTADNLSAKALGTAFNVRLVAGISWVAVAEGTVEVAFPYIIDGAPTTIIGSRQITAGQHVSGSVETGLGQTKTIPMSSVAAWRNKRLLYDGVSLIELAADASRYVAEKIIVVAPDGQLDDIRVRGSFQSSDIDGMLASLAEIYAIEIDRSQDGLIRILPVHAE